MRGQRTKDDPDFSPYGSSMAATTAVVACRPEFSSDRYTYDGGWDIYAAGDSAQKSRLETSHAQAQMDERGENDRDFSIDAKMQDVRGVSSRNVSRPSSNG